jgi:hypothetical protein
MKRYLTFQCDPGEETERLKNMAYTRARNTLIPEAQRNADTTLGAKFDLDLHPNITDFNRQWTKLFLDTMDKLWKEHGDYLWRRAIEQIASEGLPKP